MGQTAADVAIIDYGMGNLRSVAKAFEKLGAVVAVTRSPEVIVTAKRVVLPGVGAFGDCMDNIRQYGLDTVIYQLIADDKPFLGICLGLQMLFEGSDEAPGVKGLGIFPGFVRKIEASGLKVPHMGWNSLQFHQTSLLFNQLSAAPFVYFVHSYHAVPADPSLLTASTTYGGIVTAAVGRGKVQAVQFHPEKSSASGMSILNNFLAVE
ncbi:imidazole glycerol phosphate synthase subunit HisH [Anaerosporomusa subterranea]|jgi:glutamine amidotransferase|uniref:Imidazole glycerol phosphate synthase subunit HisH n=1 Tax=Anaerosporomusa subterranea TaxID=1794912 RepID=A0A154BMU2_ANASB|nr:imidazole glycerol phosphate synthase subunit HisH [Anaerosporomusa subterranea]KYZ75195.1 imidazole glycerol phosphate synthase subunit HisH [Anaerosporomusa subterranea]MDF2499796.1 Imidazole glycerol phosphate synthase subunit hisH [Anaerosporomusa subterranea]